MSYKLFKLLSTGCLQDELLDSNLFIIIGEFMGNKSVLYKDIFVKNKRNFTCLNAICKVYYEYKWSFIVVPTWTDTCEILGVGINKNGNCKIVDSEENLNHTHYKHWINIVSENYAKDMIDPIKYISNKGWQYDRLCTFIKQFPH